MLNTSYPIISHDPVIVILCYNRSYKIYISIRKPCTIDITPYHRTITFKDIQFPVPLGTSYSNLSRQKSL